MKSRTKALLAGTLGLGLTLAGAGGALAASPVGGAPVNPMSGLVSAIATKFGLNQADVQKVFDDEFAAHKADMVTKVKEMEANRLAQAVSAGKITQAQADIITAKLAELKVQFEALSGKSGQDLKDSAKAIQDEVKQWASENNIPEEYLRPGFGHFRGHGMGMMKTSR